MRDLVIDKIKYINELGVAGFEKDSEEFKYTLNEILNILGFYQEDIEDDEDWN